jgi:hypothetical protein
MFIRARSVRDLYLFVRDMFIRARFVRDLYCLCAIYFFVRDLYSSCAIGVSFCAPRARDVFVGPGFEPLAMQHDLFIGPRFDSGPGYLFQASEILGLRHSPPRMEQQVAPQTKKNSFGGKKGVCMTGCPLSCEAVEGNLLM